MDLLAPQWQGPSNEAAFISVMRQYSSLDDNYFRYEGLETRGKAARAVRDISLGSHDNDTREA